MICLAMGKDMFLIVGMTVVQRELRVLLEFLRFCPLEEGTGEQRVLAELVLCARGAPRGLFSGWVFLLQRDLSDVHRRPKAWLPELCSYLVSAPVEGDRAPRTGWEVTNTQRCTLTKEESLEGAV